MDTFFSECSILNCAKKQQLKNSLMNLQKQFEGYSELNHFASILNPEEDQAGSVQQFLRMKGFLIELCSFSMKLFAEIDELQDVNNSLQDKIGETREDLFKIAEMNIALEEQNSIFERQLQQANSKIGALEKQKDEMSLKVDEAERKLFSSEKLFEQKIKELKEDKNQMTIYPLQNQMQEYKVTNQLLKLQIQELKRQIRSITLNYEEELQKVKKDNRILSQSSPLQPLSLNDSPETSRNCIQKQLNEFSSFIGFQNHTLNNNSRLSIFDKKQKSSSNEIKDQKQNKIESPKIISRKKKSDMKTDLTTNYDILSNEQQALPINKDNWFKYNKIKSEDKECTLKNLHNYLQKKIIIDRIKGVDAHQLIYHKNS